MITNNANETAVRHEAWLALLYFAALLAWLFLTVESEASHWLSMVIIPLLLLILLRERRSERPVISTALASCGLKRGNLSRGVLWAVLIGLAISVLQLQVSQRGEAIMALVRSGRAFILFPLVFVLMLATAAFTEEFFFRGVLQTRLAALLRSRWLAVVLTSILFGAYHLPYAYLNPNWPSHGDFPAAMSAAFGQGIVGGLVLGAIYAGFRQNLLAPVLCHALINTLPAMTMIRMAGPQ